MRSNVYGLALAALLCSAAQAAVTNPSFETGNLTGWSSQIPSGWDAHAIVVDNMADQLSSWPQFDPTLPGTADGQHYGSLRGHGSENGGPLSAAYAWQQVGALQADTTYTLTIAIGAAKYDGSVPPSEIALVNGTNQTGTILSSANVSSLAFGLWANNFKDLTTTFTTGASVSGDLTILLRTPGGFQTYDSMKFDNVRLSSEPAVPEPGTLGVIGLALTSLLTVRRRAGV